MTFEGSFTFEIRIVYARYLQAIITCMRSNVYVVMALAGTNEATLFACDQIQIASIFSGWILFV